MAQKGDWSEYEWDVEEVTAVADEDHDEGDIQEHWFQESAAECIAHLKKTPYEGCRWEIVLVLDTDAGRSWAYVDMDTLTLPEFFEDAAGCETRKVPQRFKKELEKATHAITSAA